MSRPSATGSSPSTRARVSGPQAEHKKAEDELDAPRALALRDWDALTTLADALVERSYDHYRGWGSVVIFAAATAARIGEVSGVRVRDIDQVNWIWTVRRQTTPAPGGLIDKGTKGKIARRIPLIEEVRPLVAQRLIAVGRDPDARLLTTQRYLHPDLRALVAAGKSLSNHLSGAPASSRPLAASLQAL